MKKVWLRGWLASTLFIAFTATAAREDAVNAPPQGGQIAPPAVHITGLFDGAATQAASDHVGLNHKLWVALSDAPALPADRYALFLNDNEVKGLGPPIQVTYPKGKDGVGHALVYKLRRTNDNDELWKDLLGSPKTGSIPVTVSLGERPESCDPSGPCRVSERRITGEATQTTFQFQIYSRLSLTLAVTAIVFVLILVWGHARTRTTLRDNLLPQLQASCQPYSLGRWQMAFWFTLIFASFVFLFILLWDTNTVTAQALSLMGISGATAWASIAIDAAKDSPADAANRGLQALGINTYDDVIRLRRELDERRAKLAVLPPSPSSVEIAATSARHAHHPSPIQATLTPEEQQRRQLQLEMQDRYVLLRTYDEKIKPFVSQGWFKDITTDLNGTAVHRLQVLCWTLALGVVFIINVYRNLTMPEFNATLLALMGISCAGYVGFKYPEVNS